MDQMQFKFQGFHPSDFTRHYLTSKMDWIFEQAPYGATLDANFSRRDHQFKAVVTIHSSAGRFFAVASGSKLRVVTEKVAEQLFKQLAKWKSKRFQAKERVPTNRENVA